MALRDYRRFFAREDEEAEDVARAKAREILDWASQPYHARFLSWLEAEAGKPIRISGDQLVVLESAVRSNTLREIRSYLLRIRESAESSLQR